MPCTSQDVSADRIQVLIVDDHPVVRNGLRFFLMAFQDLQLVGEAASGEQALRLCERLRPEVVIMDLVMPHMDGVCATRSIRQRWPHVYIIALTSFGEEELVQGALDAGAAAFLMKNVSADELAEAIRAARAGQQMTTNR